MSFLALCAFVNRLGLEASSGYGVACKIVNFAMLVPSALMQSMASFVSQNIGAGKTKRAKKSMFTGIGVGLVVGCMVFLLVMLISRNTMLKLQNRSIIKNKNIIEQSKLNKEERKANIQGVYKLIDSKNIKNKNIIVIMIKYR